MNYANETDATLLHCASYHVCKTEGAVEQETLSSSSQQDLMGDHGAAQHLPARHRRRKMSLHMKHSSTACLNLHMLGQAPESTEPLHPQQRTWREFGKSLSEEEEGDSTPVFRAQLLNHLQQRLTWKTNTHNLLKML